jgi:hypothetical protein
MKRLLWLAVLAVPLWASSPGRALAWCFNDLFPPMQVDAGVNCHVNVHAYDWPTCGNVGPWYLYFPYEAHFQMPAPLYPNWPSSMAPETGPGPLPPPPRAGGPPPGEPLLPPTGPFTPPGGPGKGAPPGKMPPVPDGAGPALQPQALFYRPPQTPAYQPVSYAYPQPANYPVSMPVYRAPAYWYGR